MYLSEILLSEEESLAAFAQHPQAGDYGQRETARVPLRRVWQDLLLQERPDQPRREPFGGEEVRVSAVWPPVPLAQVAEAARTQRGCRGRPHLCPLQQAAQHPVQAEDAHAHSFAGPAFCLQVLRPALQDEAQPSAPPQGAPHR